VVGRSSGDIPHCAKTAFFSGNGIRNEIIRKIEKFCENSERKITKLTCCNAKKTSRYKTNFLFLSLLIFVTLAVIFIAH